MGRDRRTPGEPGHTVASFDLRGGSCDGTTWGGCVGGGGAAAAAAVGESLVSPDVAVAPGPGPEPGLEPDADTDADAEAAAGAGEDVEALAPFRAVGVFALAPALEEASRWSSALSASAL